MKQKLFTLLFFNALSFPTFGQILNGTGISLNNANNATHISGNLSPNSGIDGFLGLVANTNSSDGASIFLWNRDVTYPYKNGAVDLCSYGTTGHGIRFVNFNPNTGFWRDNMALTKDGKLIIGTPTTFGWDGTTSPGSYKLYVESGILTERVKVAVKTTTDWSDFVFAKNYKLKPLSEVEKFIKKYKHLPDLPSADKMVQQGNDLGKTDALLLQKIEELTLYMIALKKENEAIKKQLAELIKK